MQESAEVYSRMPRCLTKLAVKEASGSEIFPRSFLHYLGVGFICLFKIEIQEIFGMLRRG